MKGILLRYLEGQNSMTQKASIRLILFLMTFLKFILLFITWMLEKVYKNPEEALSGLLFDGMTIMSGGFGVCGLPENLILALKDSKVKNLTVISNNAGTEGHGLGLLLETKQISKAISSTLEKINYLRSNIFQEK